MLLTILLFAFGLTVVTCQTTCLTNCNNHGICQSGTCVCDEGWTGSDCTIQLSALQKNVMVTGDVNAWSWRFYILNNDQTGATIRLVMHPQNSQNTGDCDIFVLLGELPTSLHYDKANIDWGSEATLLVENAAAGRWYIGVYANFLTCAYTLIATIETPAGSCAEGCVNGQCVTGTCVCNAGWQGPSCSEEMTTTPLTINSWVSGSVASGVWTYYNVELTKDYSKMNISLNVTSVPILDHDCDIYVRHGALPSLLEWDYQDASIVNFVTVSIPNAVKGTWYIGVWGFRPCEFLIMPTVTNDICLSQCSAHGTCSPPCQCNSGYVGSYCQNKTSPLATDEQVVGFVDQNTWNYYSYRVDSSQYNVVIDVVQDDDQKADVGDADVYVKLASPPSRFQYDYLEISVSKKFSLVIPDVVDSMIYIGVFGWRGVGYSLKIRLTQSCPSCVHGNCTEFGICDCYPGWSGPACDAQLNVLVSGQPVTGLVNSSGEWQYYRFTSTASTVVVSLKEEGTLSPTTGLLYLLIAEAYEPTLREFTYMDVDLNKGFHTIQMILDNRAQDRTISWVVGVYGSPYVVNPVAFTLVMWQPPAA